MPPPGPQPCARLPAQAPFRAAPAPEASSLFYFLRGPLCFLRARGGPEPLSALHGVQSRVPGVSPAGRPARGLKLGSGRQSRPSHSTMVLSPSGASRTPPDFSAPQGTGRGPAPLGPPPGGNSWAPASLLQGDPLRPPSSLRPSPHAWRPLPQSTAGSAPPHTLGPERGPDLFQTGPQFLTFTRALNCLEMACFSYGFVSAPPEQGD
ncbi:hypothetical protein NDU88_002771 [Pleurodeles waltl]|uniref:Uncharacterized protein n=1 Tax=Pleurodeles waltl TaxID=8319 RepID=A0AAV7LDE4_PLEWA|nr:hypothetical protein NDU88_002771 [Pleurodeles waltl]